MARNYAISYSPSNECSGTISMNNGNQTVILKPHENARRLPRPRRHR
jgi:hypothetical protein